MWSMILAPALVVAAAPAQQDTLAERFVALEDAFDEAQEAWYEELRAGYAAAEEAGTEDEYVWPEPIEPAWFPRFDALSAEGHVPATVWCLGNYESSGVTGLDARKDKSKRYLDVLSSEPSDELLVQLIYPLQGEASTSMESEDAPLDSLGKESAFALIELIFALASEDETKARTLLARGDACKPYYNATNAQLAEAAAWFRRAATEFGETDSGMRAGGLLFAAENLKIGQVAPDIVGKDHDGNDVKRSDFEGKVTVIDFWGFW